VQAVPVLWQSSDSHLQTRVPIGLKICMHGISDLQRCEQVPGFGDGFLEFPLGCPFRG
jgi:hypothetical protein